jgi:hypothetical protein
MHNQLQLVQQPPASNWRTAETEPLMPIVPSPGWLFNAVTA